MIAQPLLLFVTGIPSKTTAREIEDLFLDLGQFQILCLKSTKDTTKIQFANPLPNLRRGFCILEAMNPFSYFAALEKVQIKILNHSLKITKFLIGRELDEFTKEEESRRVVVKRVPHNLPQEYLIRALERHFGLIRRAFQYEVPSKKRSCKSLGKYCSYSVEFDSAESARLATNAWSMSLVGVEHPIIIEGFKRRNEVKEKMICYHDQIITFSDGGSCNPCESSGLISDMNRQKFDPLIKLIPVGGNSKRIVLNFGGSDLNLHFQKPTSTAYFESRLALRSKNQAGSHCGAASGHLRFNISV